MASALLDRIKDKYVAKDIEAFLSACEEKKTYDIKKLLSFTDEAGQTPLHLAIANGDPELVQILLGFDANIKVANHSGKTCLDFATDLAFKETNPESQKKRAIVLALVRTRGNWGSKSFAQGTTISFNRLVRALEMALSQTDIAKDKPGILVLGLSQDGGKSTLINYMLGIDYIPSGTGIMSNVTPVFPKDVTKEPAERGTGGLSKTSYATAHSLESKPYNWIDMPGYKDSREGIKKLTSAIALPLVSKMLPSVKGIIIAMPQVFLETAGSFKEIFEELKIILQKNPGLKENLILAITKPDGTVKIEGVQTELRKRAEEFRSDGQDELADVISFIAQDSETKKRIVMADVAHQQDRFLGFDVVSPLRWMGITQTPTPREEINHIIESFTATKLDAALESTETRNLQEFIDKVADQYFEIIKDIDTKEKKLTELEDNKKNIEKQLKGVETTKNLLEQSLKTKEKEKNGKSKELTDLRARIAEKEARIKKLKNLLNSLQSGNPLSAEGFPEEFPEEFRGFVTSIADDEATKAKNESDATAVAIKSYKQTFTLTQPENTLIRVAKSSNSPDCVDYSIPGSVAALAADVVINSVTIWFTKKPKAHFFKPCQYEWIPLASSENLTKYSPSNSSTISAKCVYHDVEDTLEDEYKGITFTLTPETDKCTFQEISKTDHSVSGRFTTNAFGQITMGYNITIAHKDLPATKKHIEEIHQRIINKKAGLIDLLNAQISSLTRELAADKERESTLLRNIQSLEKEITKLKTDITKTTDEISQIQTKLTSCNAKISEQKRLISESKLDLSVNQAFFMRIGKLIKELGLHEGKEKLSNFLNELAKQSPKVSFTSDSEDKKKLLLQQLPIFFLLKSMTSPLTPNPAYNPSGSSPRIKIKILEAWTPPKHGSFDIATVSKSTRQQHWKAEKISALTFSPALAASRQLAKLSRIALRGLRH